MLKAIRFVTAGVVLSLVIAAMQSGVFATENATPMMRADRKPMPACGPGGPWPISSGQKP